MTLVDLLHLALFLVPCVFSLLFNALLRSWAIRLGLVDLPGARKVHTQPTPRAGGLAIYASMVLTAVLFYEAAWAELALSLATGFFIVVLGLMDDLWSLPWYWRLGVQFLTATVVVCGWYGMFAWPVQIVAIFWLVGLINAFNMLDNMDGLSAGVAWIAAGLFGLTVVIHAGASWSWPALAPNVILMGALTGFLWFNLPPARLFMGDAGSTFLGFFLGLRSLNLVAADATVSRTWLVPFCILAVPCYDLVTVVALRLWQGKSPFHADKQHLSHRLVALGLRSPTAVRIIYLLGLASGLGSLVLYRTGTLGTLLLLAQLACFWLAVAALEYFRHFRSRIMQHE